jgi:hypothetical protein
VLVRAHPESVRLTDTYYYEQKIARNQRITARQAPTGRIEVVVPYDGERFFGRQARQDVLRQLGPTAPPGTEALIGHLALLAADRTDLASMADLGGPSGSVPLLVPVTLGNLGYPGWLRDDRRACEIGYDYRPDDPERSLVWVRLRQEDEEEWIPAGESRESLDRQATQASSFHPDLLVRLDVMLRLPSQPEEPSMPPRVSRVALDWPSLTSLRGLSLTVAGDRHPFAYDPEASRLTWTDVPIEPVRRRPSDADHRDYASKPMALAIHQPGELYQETSLGGRVEVEVPGRLLSGLQARLFDGTGRRCDDPVPELSNRLVLDFRFVLDEAFARRELHPYQLLHFDELIPDHLRLADIKAALQDRGFWVEEPIKEFSTANPDDLAAYLVARMSSSISPYLLKRSSCGGTGYRTVVRVNPASWNGTGVNGSSHFASSAASASESGPKSCPPMDVSSQSKAVAKCLAFTCMWNSIEAESGWTWMMERLLPSWSRYAWKAIMRGSFVSTKSTSSAMRLRASSCLPGLIV